MKTHKSFLGAAVLAAMVLVPTRGAFAQFPAGATMTVLPARGGSNTITVHDAGNRSWVLEVSTNFTAWTEAATWKIHNGSYHATVPAAPAGRAFYRAFYDSGRTGPVSTVASALRLPAITADYTPTLPPHYLAPPVQNQDNTPAGNPTTDLGATLGRVLFYDKRLSTNGTVSCSSCHQQQNGFSDPRRFSVGFNGGLTGRNSMGLANARYYPNGRFFWDERAATLEAQVLQPIQNSVEMGMTLPALVARLGAEPFYTNLFASVFGTPEVNTNRISRALAQFIRSMVSTGSKYDAGVAVGFTNFTAQELLGRQVFLGQVGNATCAACHGTDAHTAPGLNNNGLEFPYVDAGAGAITGRPQDNGRFKVRIEFAICSTMIGASPSDGSSSSTQRGLPIRVRAMVSICCSPPDMRPPGRSRMRARLGNSANSLSSLQLGAPSRGACRPTTRFSITERSVKMRRSSGT